ncbi:uncharacterized protein [Lepeophtheirus salmonis]|uniref:uncharacterized protein n=1 Tax=Lepeophtheirus salmonis TaxID=72036 RepID=UPI001AE20B9E|nr:ankyrin repeat and ELMO domain-containing protein D-like [Lepeophtheirus salmonis]
MAYRLIVPLLLFEAVFVMPMNTNKNNGPPPVTCPGYPGYCSESYPGDTCLVVCAFGRNNVPECQPDGTWTDVPRCIEHEPGIPEQIPGICPGIPGYCSLDYPGALCEFDCLTGPDISSFCTPDGTWDPYPTCDGDVRETRDGCKECPGPFEGQEIVHKREITLNNNSPRNNFNNNKPPQQHKNNNNFNQSNNKRPSNNGNFNSQRPKDNHFSQSNNKRPSSNGNFDSRRPNGNNNNNNKQSAKMNNSNFKNSNGRCPGNALEDCLDACPSSNTRIFKACVLACDRRCPNKK